MKKLPLFLFLFLMLLNLYSAGFFVGAQETSGNISFQPNVIPETSVTFNNSRFVFDWLGNHFEVAIYLSSSEEFELEVEENKVKLKVKLENGSEIEREVEYEVVVEEASSNITWGLNIWNIPKEITDNVDFLVWKIEGASFEVDEIEVEEIEVFEEGYNITRLHLPDNLVLSYEDLVLYNFMVSHPNKYETIVKGVKGKSSWNLDPITFSSPIITVTGFTEGTPCIFWDVWNASDVNGWDVVWNNRNNNNQFQFDARILIGDGENETWFADSKKEVYFSLTALPSSNLWAIYVNNNAHLRFGVLINSTYKTSYGGISLMAYTGGSTCYFIYGAMSPYPDIQIYSSMFQALYYRMYLRNIRGSKIYNTLFNNVQAWLLFGNDLSRLNLAASYYAVDTWSGGNISDIQVYSATYAIRTDTSYGMTIKNLKVRKSTYAFLHNKITVDKYIINGDIDNWNHVWISPSTAELFRQYTFDLTFTFGNGSYAEGTNVTISNSYLGTSDSWILTSNGSIPQQTYSYGHYNQTGGNSLYDYNPYNITATLDGYQTYSTLLNITEKEDLTIALQPAGKSAGWMLAGLAILALISISVVVIVVVRRP